MPRPSWLDFLRSAPWGRDPAQLRDHPPRGMDDHFPPIDQPWEHYTAPPVPLTDQLADARARAAFLESRQPAADLSPSVVPPVPGAPWAPMDPRTRLFWALYQRQYDPGTVPPWVRDQLQWAPSLPPWDPFEMPPGLMRGGFRPRFGDWS
jgi:hypothetical protein